MDCFLKRFSTVLCDDKDDAIFDTLKMVVGGTTSARIAKLLNFAVSQMADSECYLEVGVFTGGTLCSANHLNVKTCIGIDNYDAFEIGKMSVISPSQVRDRCLYNINSIGQLGTRLIEKDFRDVTAKEIGKPVAVSFIDGKHYYKDVLENLEWLHPLLADNAVILFDDVNYLDVSTAILDWVADHRDTYDLTSYIKPFYQDGRHMSSLTERFLNNGLCVLRYHKDPAYGAWILPEYKIKEDKHATHSARLTPA